MRPMQDYIADIKKYDSNPDHDAVEKIARYLSIAMKNHDASLVAVTDPTEVARVEKNWAQDQLHASAQDAHEAVAFVARQMDGVRNKSRVTFYYLVAKRLGKLHSVPA